MKNFLKDLFGYAIAWIVIVGGMGLVFYVASLDLSEGVRSILGTALTIVVVVLWVRANPVAGTGGQERSIASAEDAQREFDRPLRAPELRMRGILPDPDAHQGGQ